MQKRAFENLSLAERRERARVTKAEARMNRVDTTVYIRLGDARTLDWVGDESIHLVVTSPPYWTLKKYNDHDDQLGAVADYEEFLDQLDRVWRHVYRVLVPGGRLVCVVGDVCLSRRQHGRHMVMPLHSDIAVRCRKIGFDNLNPIIWHKISNANYEVASGSSFLGKPYEPNAIIKNDIEFILMERKPGGYRKPTAEQRSLSMIDPDDFNSWFQQIWTLTGASTRRHPAPFPVELSRRLVAMFSFVGDTVLDPFVGTGSTLIAASELGRNSIGVEIDPEYATLAVEQLSTVSSLFSTISVRVEGLEPASTE